MGREGFLCTAVAPDFGGLGGDFLYSVIALEEVAKTNHYGLDAFLHSDIVVPYIDAYGTPEQKKKYLPGCVTGDIITAVAMTEPGTGSDLASMEATAVDDGDALDIAADIDLGGARRAGQDKQQDGAANGKKLLCAHRYQLRLSSSGWLSLFVCVVFDRNTMPKFYFGMMMVFRSIVCNTISYSK